MTELEQIKAQLMAQQALLVTMAIVLTRVNPSCKVWLPEAMLAAIDELRFEGAGQLAVNNLRDKLTEEFHKFGITTSG